MHKQSGVNIYSRCLYESLCQKQDACFRRHDKSKYRIFTPVVGVVTNNMNISSIIEHINYNIRSHFKGFFALFRWIFMLAGFRPAIGYVGLIRIIYAQPAV